MQCLKIEPHAVTAVTAVVVVMMVTADHIPSNRNQRREENNSAG